MNFGHALENLVAGERVSRSGWNGKDMWLILIRKNDWSIANCLEYLEEEIEEMLKDFNCAPFIAMKTADDQLVPWLALQTDMLAEDWEIV